MKRITGILIKSKECSVEQVVLDPENIQEMRELVGCRILSAVKWDRKRPREEVFIDDEGLLGSPRHFFKIPGCQDWIAGNGLITAIDKNGNCVSTDLMINDVTRHVKFGKI